MGVVPSDLEGENVSFKCLIYREHYESLIYHIEDFNG